MNSRTGEMAWYETKSTKQESKKNINLGIGMQRDCEQNDQEAKKAMAGSELSYGCDSLIKWS